jgi:hypothetical protein
MLHLILGGAALSALQQPAGFSQRLCSLRKDFDFDFVWKGRGSVRDDRIDLWQKFVVTILAIND